MNPSKHNCSSKVMENLQTSIPPRIVIPYLSTKIFKIEMGKLQCHLKKYGRAIQKCIPISNLNILYISLLYNNLYQYESPMELLNLELNTNRFQLFLTYYPLWKRKKQRKKTGNSIFRKVLTLPPMTRILIPGRADTMEGNSGSLTVYYEGPFG